MGMNLAELGIDLEIGPGRRPSGTVLRELAADDLAHLAAPRRAGAALIKKMTERHQALARLLAGGTRPTDAAVMLGYTDSYISILQDDPAFQNLVAVYRNDQNIVYADFQARLAGLSKDALLELQGRLEETPDDFSIGQLTEIATRFGDRAGYGPVARSENINLNANIAVRLGEARRRAKESLVLEAEVVDEPRSGQA